MNAGKPRLESREQSQVRLPTKVRPGLHGLRRVKLTNGADNVIPIRPPGTSPEGWGRREQDALLYGFP
jgi:hypothetical protein